MKPRLLSVLIAAALFTPGAFGQENPVTAVGYYNLSLVPGFNLVSKQLFSPGSYLSNFTAGIQGPVPDGLTVYLLEPNGFRAGVYDAQAGAFTPAFFGGELIPPGRGFFVFNPSTNQITWTVAGELLQGSLTNSLRAGFSIVSSMVPQQATLETLDFPAEQGDVAFLWDQSTQKYLPSSYDDIEGGWLPPLRPLEVGEAFILYKVRPALWIRQFEANPR